MKQLLIATAAISLTLGASGAALAQPHDDHMAGRAPMAPTTIGTRATTSPPPTGAAGG